MSRELELTEADDIEWAIDKYQLPLSDGWKLSVEAKVAFDDMTDCRFGIASEYETEPSRTHAEMHKEDIISLIDKSGVFDDVDLSVE